MSTRIWLMFWTTTLLSSSWPPKSTRIETSSRSVIDSRTAKTLTCSWWLRWTYPGTSLGARAICQGTTRLQTSQMIRSKARTRSLPRSGSWTCKGIQIRRLTILCSTSRTNRRQRTRRLGKLESWRNYFIQVMRTHHKKVRILYHLIRLIPKKYPPSTVDPFYPK